MPVEIRRAVGSCRESRARARYRRSRSSDITHIYARCTENMLYGTFVAFDLSEQRVFPHAL